MLVQKVIEQLGYSPREAKIYLTSLGLGEARISKIAAKAKIPRTSAEGIADKLQKNGLMDYYIQRRYKYWTAESPERLLSTIEKRSAAVREAIPTLTNLRKAARGAKKRSATSLQDALFLRILADSSVQPMLIANEQVEIEYVNPAWERQFGYELEEVRGENPRVLQSGKTPRSVYEKMWKELRAGKTFQSDEIIDMKADGSFFNLLSTLFPIVYGGRTYYIQILSDISEQKRVDALKKDLLQIKTLKP